MSANPTRTESPRDNVNKLGPGSLWRLTVLDGELTFVVEGSDDLVAAGTDSLELASIWVDLHAHLMTMPVGVSEAEGPDPNTEPGETGRRALAAAIESVRSSHPRRATGRRRVYASDSLAA